MVEFFAGIYEWWGLNPLYSSDLGDHLRGYDSTCSSFSGTPLYAHVGVAMFLIVFIGYALYYHIIDSPRIQRRFHWLITLLIIVTLNFAIAFILPFNSISTGDFCIELAIEKADILGFGISNSIWSIILFVVISALPFPRKLSTNCRHTPWNQ
jgi:cytochrome bd-type quinol oxidase subunit 1